MQFLYKDILENIEAFDTSDYPKTHALYSKTNCKVLGEMKDEYNGKLITEFVGLRPKMYSIKTVDGFEKKNAKGIVPEIFS